MSGEGGDGGEGKGGGRKELEGALLLLRRCSNQNCIEAMGCLQAAKSRLRNMHKELFS